MNWNNDPVFRASLHSSERDRLVRTIPCEVETTHYITVEETTIRLTLGRLFTERVGGPQRNLKLVDIAEVDANGARSVARVFLGADPLDSELRFEPQARKLEGGIFIRLSPRNNWLFRLQDGKLYADLAFGWRDALDESFPVDGKSGQNLSLDLERMEGRIAIRSIERGEPERLGSAYDESRMLVAKLAVRDGRLVAEATDVRPQEVGVAPLLDRVREMDQVIRSRTSGLPEGVEPCMLGAWSTDADPNGLNVRAAPSANAKVLGIVPPPIKAPKSNEALGPEPVKAELQVIGHRNGWFLIEKITAPGVAYDIPYPRHLLQPFNGRGWVSGRMIGGALANGGLPTGRLYHAPHADAAGIDVTDSHGNEIGPDTPIRRIHACSGWWALVETTGGQRGWWRAMCSNQATNCS